jgi:hypothetical protein
MIVKKSEDYIFSSAGDYANKIGYVNIIKYWGKINLKAKCKSWIW